MDLFFQNVPLVFLAIALVTLLIGAALVLDVSFADALRDPDSGAERGLIQRFWPPALDPDVALLAFWASLVLAVALSLLVAVWG